MDRELEWLEEIVGGQKQLVLVLLLVEFDHVRLTLEIRYQHDSVWY